MQLVTLRRAAAVAVWCSVLARPSSAQQRDTTTPPRDSLKVYTLPPAQTPGAFQNLSYKPYGIIIEGDEDYQREIEMTLAWIARSDTGMILLNGIRRTGKQIRISPWQGTTCNAMANPVADEDAILAVIHPVVYHMCDWSSLSLGSFCACENPMHNYA